MEDIVKEHIKTLANINATNEIINISEEDFAKRRAIIKRLSHLDVIELDKDKFSGKFAFNTKEGQDLYLNEYEKRKDYLKNEHTKT
jgi:glucose-6-phosphate 1-dehydrogenase